MNYLKLTFGDIMQSKILFYDKEVEEACIDICDTLHIDNMPDIDGMNYHERVNGKFILHKIEKIHRLDIDQPIFTDELVKKFEK